MEVIGPMKTKSKGDAKRVLTFVDVHFLNVVTYFLKAKR